MPDIDISRPPAAPEFVRFVEGFGQRFVITIDTEEEFDWDAPIDRQRHGLVSVPALREFQEFCEGFDVVPLYLLDQPIAEAPATRDALGDAVAAGRAEIGVHLHPWLSPPFDEAVNEVNSFAGNLPPALEREKFAHLRRTIEAHFAASPVTYRAGRYGIGPNSAAILGEAGMAIDTSVRALFDYAPLGGPDFSRHPRRPYWIDRPGGLMELPLTAVYWGPLRQLGGRVHPALRRIPRLAGAAAWTGMLQRIPLSPEGVDEQEALRAIDIALDEGLPLLVFSFHSPSLAPGNTPYVRSEGDLANFYDWWRTVFAYLAKRRVAPSNIGDILASVVLA